MMIRPKNSLQQKVWNYIRRNPSFRYGDILMLVQVSDSALDRYLRALVQAKFIKRETPISTKRADSEYSAIASLGGIAPILNQAKTILYDPNTQETYSLKDGEVIYGEDHTNKCLRYSRLLGKDYNFLAGYKHRYQHEHPELKTVEEWYEHAKSILERHSIVCEKLQKIKEFLSQKRELASFSHSLFGKQIFTYKRSFENGIKHILKPNRVLMHEDTLKRYESVVVEFETRYGAINTSKVAQ